MVLVVLVIPVLFELLQLVIPYRAFNINDMVAKGVGAMIGLVGILSIFVIRESRIKY